MRDLDMEEKIYISENDYEVLDEIVDRFGNLRQGELLEREISRAEIFSDEEMPENVVTLHSRTRVLDETTGEIREFTLVPPDDFEPEEGKISVLAPLGAAVIGLTEGQTIEWPTAKGEYRRYRVIELLFQPEAERKRSRGRAASSKGSGSPRGVKNRPSPGRRLDRVDRASLESFPASDPPGWRL